MRQLNGIFTQSSIADTNGSVICSKGNSKRYWSTKSHTWWSCALHSAQFGAGEERGKSGRMEMEQLPTTAGFVAVPEFLSTDCLLEQFSKNRRVGWA